MNGNKTTWIQSASNTKIDFLNPNPASINIKDIALGLSRQPRYSGQGKFFYSVAQHSVYAAALVKNPTTRIYALLHDAHEAYMGDIPGPLKSLLGNNLLEIEVKLQHAIYVALDIEQPSVEELLEVHKVDRGLLMPEYHKLYDKYLWNLNGEPDLPKIPDGLISSIWNHEEAMDMFLAYYKSIKGRQLFFSRGNKNGNA